jgi:hypothetical protein
VQYRKRLTVKAPHRIHWGRAGGERAGIGFEDIVQDVTGEREEHSNVT